MIYVGIDWAEAHHDVCVEDGEGHVLAKADQTSTHPVSGARSGRPIGVVRFGCFTFRGSNVLPDPLIVIARWPLET